MVDPHQVLIDNGNNSSRNLIQMNDSDTSKQKQNQELQQSFEVNSVTSGEVTKIYENRQNAYIRPDDYDEIMCGPLVRNCTNSTIKSDDNNSTIANNTFSLVDDVQNGDDDSSLISNNFARDIESINVSGANKVCVIVTTNKQTRESDDSYSQQTLPSTSINSADTETQEYSAEFQSNTTIALDNNHIDVTIPNLPSKMDSRKVEPLRININRDPIKTKIKLGPPPEDRQTMSPKSSSSSTAGNDDGDDDSEMPHENQQSYPKIKIKPIVKPPTEVEHHHNHTGSHVPSSSQEAIPKLKIKKVDSNNSNSSSLTPLPTHSAALNNDDISGNYQTHLLSESSSSVPKLATVRSSTTNLLIGSNSYDEDNCTVSNEVVPKLTIKRDNHNLQSAAGESPRSLVSNAGVKLTLKPIAEPPLPRFTITRFNDTTKVVMLNNSEQTDESSDELPSQPPSSQPSPNDKVSSRSEYATHAITSTSSSFSGPNAEDNLSTCSSGSSSSYSSSSSTANANSDIKLIIKATSTGGCVVSPNSSVMRNSPSSMKSANNLKVSSSGEQSKLNHITSNVVTSSNSNDSIPKLNIKLSNTEYLQVIHNETEQNETRNEIDRTESPLPKLIIRKKNTNDENIVIPKVTIKPVVNPNENLEQTNSGAQLVTPKIIPKPIEKPLEIITSGQNSPFRNSENESQQSPRIILKINKNSTSQTNESSTLTSTTIIAEEPITRDDLSQPAKQNELKRSNHESDNVLSKKQKLGTDIVQLLSSDSETDDMIDEQPTTNNNYNDSNQNQSNNKRDSIVHEVVPTQSISFDTNSGLRSILTRPQLKIQPQPIQNFLQTLPPFKSTSDSSKINDVIDLCDHDSNDQMIDVPLDEESTSKEVSDTKQYPESIDTNKTSVGKQNRNSEQSKNSSYNWQYFYSESEKEQIEPIHPLLQQDIERANVLAAMMEAANNKERSTNGSNNNNMAKNDEFNQIENEGSDSDCIVIEDTASDPFTNEYGDGDNSAEQNGRKKECIDRDSGVDVSNSVKSINEDDVTPVVKRPRGRPRKGTTPKTVEKKPVKTPGKKRKFAGILMSQENARIEEPTLEVNKLTIESLTSIATPLEQVPVEIAPVQLDPQEDIANTIQQTTTVLTMSDTMTITSITAPIAMDTSENDTYESTIRPIKSLENDIEQTELSVGVDVSMNELIATPVSGQSSFDKTVGLISPTTPSVPKERKKRIIIDDDDESPTFNPLRSTKKSKCKNRRSRHSSLLKKQRKVQILSPSDKLNENAVFTSPEGIELRKVALKDTTAQGLQVFEEDTRMSADSLFASPSIRTTEFLQNDESQSSLHSSTSATVENSTKKIRSKIEVIDPEGRTEFTVDMIAEYDWPPPKGCCPSRNRDTYMIQEQIAEYLGVKSFKRKYPDLPRRMVEMEERNYLMEKGLVSEKMCDLGLTAVLASDILDIMNNDFFEKYEEYRRYLREKQIRDLAARQKQMQAGVLGKSLSARENAMRAASMWNTDFNRSRKENRNECLDLQNFVIQVPEIHRNRKNRPATKPSHYPVALVPGQFQEYYRKYSPAELLCYPINTVLADPYQLDRKLREYYNKTRRTHYISDEESGDDSDSSCSSNSDSDDSDSSDDSTSSSDESTDDETKVKLEVEKKANVNKPPKEETKPVPKLPKNERNKCQVCSGQERCNQQKKPEMFISCTLCKRNAHSTCLKMSARMARRVNEYAWQCKNCKHCMKCRRSENEEKMLFCDQCDRSYHIYCIGLRKVPNGKWHCAVCTVCTLCGARRPEGHNNPNLTVQQKQKLLAVAKWTHEYQVNPTTGEDEHVSMLCTSCMAIKHSAAKNVYFN